MAGGTFDNVGEKVIPGNYINLKAQEQTALVTSTRGITVIPLANFDWGPKKTFISVDAAQPDKNFALIGRSIYDDNKSSYQRSFERCKDCLCVHNERWR